MGLTIHYSLKFKGSYEEAFAKVKALREKAMDMSFQEVSEIRHFKGQDCFFNADKYQDNNSSDSEWRWALIQSQGEGIKFTPEGKRMRANENSFNGCYWITPQPIEIILFRTYPGDGCEAANFGLARYEKYIDFHGKKVATRYGDNWLWHSFCKTQYANEKGIVNFLRCHTLVAAMLEYAQEFGILRNVSDEGGFWDKRDMKLLAEEVGRWDEFVAGIAGTLSKTFGSDNLVSEISNHPHYEKLKELGLQHLAKLMMTSHLPNP